MCTSTIQSIEYFIKLQGTTVHKQEVAFNAYMIILYIFIGFMGVMLAFFTKFHFLLVLKNITTLESLEKKGIDFQSQFDTGKRRNWEQVFGINPKMWFFPLICAGGKPMGNGVSWPQRDENGNSIMMNYQDGANSEETAEQEYRKLQTANYNNSNSIKPQESLNSKAWKGALENESDYYEKITKKKAQSKKIGALTSLKTTTGDSSKQDTNKVEGIEDMSTTKKIQHFKNEIPRQSSDSREPFPED